MDMTKQDYENFVGSIAPKKVTIVDPPSGWRFGFPAPLQADYRQQLIDAGYPEKDLDFAIKYSRYWEQ